MSKSIESPVAWTALLLGVIAALAAVAQELPRSARDGVFSSAQAARGERVFASICANCHEVAEFTGPDAYLGEVDGKPLWETFDYISAEMPEDDPGSLAPEDYADVLAYLFSVYGLPSGDDDLGTDRDSLRAIAIARPILAGS